jgi:hypothetical protein
MFEEEMGVGRPRYYTGEDTPPPAKPKQSLRASLYGPDMTDEMLAQQDSYLDSLGGSITRQLPMSQGIRRVGLDTRPGFNNTSDVREAKRLSQYPAPATATQPVPGENTITPSAGLRTPNAGFGLSGMDNYTVGSGGFRSAPVSQGLFTQGSFASGTYAPIGQGSSNYGVRGPSSPVTDSSALYKTSPFRASDSSALSLTNEQIAARDAEALKAKQAAQAYNDRMNVAAAQNDRPYADKNPYPADPRLSARRDIIT